jgi:hypothetical protein
VKDQLGVKTWLASNSLHEVREATIKSLNLWRDECGLADMQRAAARLRDYEVSGR